MRNAKPSLCKGRGTTKWWKGCLLKSRKNNSSVCFAASCLTCGLGHLGGDNPSVCFADSCLACGLGHLGGDNPSVCFAASCLACGAVR